MVENSSKKSGTGLGGYIFFLTAIAMIEFFWWLLIFDHGVVSTH